MALLALLLAACAGQPVTFQLAAPVQVTDAGASIQNPAIAVDAARNRVYVAWTVYPNDIDGLAYLAVSNDGGKTFESPISIGGKWETQPELRVAEDGTLFVIWTHWNMDDLLDPNDPYSNTADQWLIKSTDGGKTFTDPVIISGKPDSPVAYFMAVAVTPDGKTVTVAWFDYTPAGVGAVAPDDGGRDATAFYTMTSHDGGRTFSAPLKTAKAICVCCFATGIVQDNHPAFVLRGFKAGGETEGDIRDPIIIASSDQGDTWNAPITIHEDNFLLDVCPHLGPGAAVDGNGRLHVTWWTGATDRAGYWYATSDDGVNFSEPVKLADQPSDMHGNDLSLAIDGRGAAWATAVTLSEDAPTPDENADTPLGVVRLWAIPQGGNPVSVDGFDVHGILPVVAASQNGAVIIWVDGSKLMLQQVEIQQ
jgi:hypothetical protein